MSNPFVHLELNTPDAAKAKAFYSELFGWEFTDNDMGPGILLHLQARLRPRGRPLLLARNARPMARLRRRRRHQSLHRKSQIPRRQIHMGPHEIPNIGWITILADPTGAAVALFQPKSA